MWNKWIWHTTSFVTHFHIYDLIKVVNFCQIRKQSRNKTHSQSFEIQTYDCVTPCFLLQNVQKKIAGKNIIFNRLKLHLDSTLSLLECHIYIKVFITTKLRYLSKSYTIVSWQFCNWCESKFIQFLCTYFYILLHRALLVHLQPSSMVCKKKVK